MTDLIRAANPLLRAAIVGGYVAGAVLASLGVVLVYLGSSGQTQFSFFGQSFVSSNVGIAAIFIGGVSLVLLVRRSLKSVDALVAHEASIAVSQGRPGRVEVTDILVDSYRPDFTAILDFRLMNRGDRSLSVSRVRFLVAEVEEVLTLGALNFSASYDLDISNLRKKGDVAEVSVSHVLTKNEVDRFRVVLTAKEMSIGVFRIWKLKPTLVTSEGEVAATTVTVGLPWDISKSSRHPGM